MVIIIKKKRYTGFLWGLGFVFGLAAAACVKYDTSAEWSDLRINFSRSHSHSRSRYQGQPGLLRGLLLGLLLTAVISSFAVPTMITVVQAKNTATPWLVFLQLVRLLSLALYALAGFITIKCICDFAKGHPRGGIVGPGLLSAVVLGGCFFIQYLLKQNGKL